MTFPVVRDAELSSSSSSLLSLFCRVFTIMYLKQTMFLGYIMLQLFCIYSLCYMWCYLAHETCSLLLHQHFLQSLCSAQYGCFCSSLNLCFHGLLLRYCRSDFEMVPVAPIITDIAFSFTFHMRWISVMWFLHFLYLLSFFLDHISVSRDCSIYWHAYLFFIIMDYESGLLLGIVLLVITCWFLNFLLPQCVAQLLSG
jgi:hypothetical protein